MLPECVGADVLQRRRAIRADVEFAHAAAGCEQAVGHGSNVSPSSAPRSVLAWCRIWALCGSSSNMLESCELTHIRPLGLKAIPPRVAPARKRWSRRYLGPFGEGGVGVGDGPDGIAGGVERQVGDRLDRRAVDRQALDAPSGGSTCEIVPTSIFDTRMLPWWSKTMLSGPCWGRLAVSGWRAIGRRCRRSRG